MIKKMDCICVGEGGPPWTSLSKESMAKVMNAILRTGSSIDSTYVSDLKYTRSSVLYSIKVPSERLEEFQKLIGYPISRHPNIQLGMDTIKSVKQIIYDLEKK